jgi:stearoyl-CoA desaturase (delta-9 desaturase)
MGELFQNNHHHAGAKPNFAAKWWEIDPTYPIIWVMDKLHIIKLVK